MPRGSCRGVKINNEAAISPFTQSRSHMHSVGGFPYPPFWFPTAITVLSLRPIVFSLHGMRLNDFYWHASHRACAHIIWSKS